MDDVSDVSSLKYMSVAVCGVHYIAYEQTNVSNAEPQHCA